MNVITSDWREVQMWSTKTTFFPKLQEKLPRFVFLSVFSVSFYQNSVCLRRQMHITGLFQWILCVHYLASSTITVSLLVHISVSYILFSSDTQVPIAAYCVPKYIIGSSHFHRVCVCFGCASLEPLAFSALHTNR